MFFLQPPSHVNCDNILYYEIFYQAVGSNDWSSTKASSIATGQNISNVRGLTNYLIKLQVVNNQNIHSRSVETMVETVAVQSEGKCVCNNLMVSVFVKKFNG